MTSDFDENRFRNANAAKAFHDCHGHCHMNPKRSFDLLVLSNILILISLLEIL